VLITHIELEDFKSYAKARIAFQPGTIAIIGPNGAGKSSLLEAIGFALFDHRRGKLANCLREGAKTGRVAVGMVSSYDEREYEVERRFTDKTTSRYRVYDLGLDRQCVAEGTDQVRVWLHDHLRVDASASLDTLFENTVGVPQGTFTAPFLLSRAQRQGVFNPLLQVEEYRKASDKLLPTARYLRDQVGEIKEQIAGMEGRLAALPGLQMERDSLGQNCARLEERSKTLASELADTLRIQEELDQAEKRAREALHRLEQLDATLSGHENLVASAKRALKESEKAIGLVEESREGHQLYLESEARFRELEKARRSRDQLLQKRSRLDTEQARVGERLAQLTKELASIADSVKRMESLAPLVAQQDALEAALESARQDAMKLESARRHQAIAAEELRRAQSDIEQQEQGLQEAAQAEARLTRVQERLDQLAHQDRRARDARAAAGSEIERLRKQSAALSETSVADIGRPLRAARCPVCEAELTPKHRAELLRRNERETRQLQAQMDARDKEIATLTNETHTAQATLKRIRQRLRLLPSEPDLERARVALTHRQRAWNDATRVVAALEDAPARVESQQLALDALKRDHGDPRREHQRHEDKAKQKESKERERGSVADRQGELAAEMRSLDLQLAPLASLDQDLRRVQLARGEHEQAHNTYLAHIRTAEQYPARVIEIGELIERQRAMRQQLADLTVAHQRAKAAYDAERHAQVRERAGALQRDLAGAKAQLVEKRHRLDVVEQEIERLEGLQTEVARKRVALKETEALGAMIETVRGLLREAGPHVTQRLVSHISRRASAIYGDIMGDHRARLHWSRDYELSLEVRGCKRVFQQLSGGERMSAALAVRLALLRETSAIDVALFDEPTAHLDPERRERLAEQMMQVKGFSQMFVISHDDTFERTAQSYVRIVKDENGSHPEG